MTKSGRRYFFEQDVIDYLWQKHEESVGKWIHTLFWYDSEVIIDRFDVGFSSANTTGYVLGEMLILGGFQVDY